MSWAELTKRIFGRIKKQQFDIRFTTTIYLFQLYTKSTILHNFSCISCSLCSLSTSVCSHCEMYYTWVLSLMWTQFIYHQTHLILFTLFLFSLSFSFCINILLEKFIGLFIAVQLLSYRCGFQLDFEGS